MESLIRVDVQVNETPPEISALAYGTDSISVTFTTPGNQYVNIYGDANHVHDLLTEAALKVEAAAASR